MKNEKRPRWTSAAMYPILQRLENSGMSQVAFARQEGLSQVVLSYWLRKYREAQNSPAPGFLAVTPGRTAWRDAVDGERVFARLVLPDGAELHFHQSVPGAYLREVLGW